MWGMGPYAGADYNLTFSHSRLQTQIQYKQSKGDSS